MAMVRLFQHGNYVALWHVATMRISRLILVALFALGAAGSFAAPPPSPEVQQLLTEGREAYTKGDLATAKSAFEMVYQIDPRNTVAIGFLRQIKVAQERMPKGVAQEKSLEALIIPKIEFHDATLREALDVLKKKAAEVSGGKQAANFVIPSADATDAPRITLSLQNIPFADAVRYIGKVANFEFRFEKYAIVGKPAGTAAPAAGATALPPAAPAAAAQ